MSNLKQHKLIEYVSDKNGITNILLTTKGKTKLKSFNLDLIKINKQKIWDKKWRLVMFDLPVRYSRARDSLRFKLKQLGFIQFQKSVWLYPYPCTDEILFVTNYYKVDMFIEIIEATNILREEKFLKAFRLKN